ncbi:hypothetical protein QUF63_13495 [Anaerolineales bacterium HSG25]|nr:hypothetical protein [Anaerolineales bacterium HSG25]
MKLLQKNTKTNRSQKSTTRKQSGLRLTTGVRAGEIDCQALNHACAQTLSEGGMGFNEACWNSVWNGC